MNGSGIALILLLIGSVRNSIIRKGNEPAQSLYVDGDEVIVLIRQNFYQNVFDRPYASYVEFYNSFCGFCRNFAPIYKEFAKSVAGWRDTIQIAAIDCADDGNNDICREMEIMQYPTLRYFPPFYRNESNNFGIVIQHLPMQVGEPNLFELMANTTNVPNNWPILNPIVSTSTESLFTSLPSNIQYIFLVHQPGTVEPIEAQRVALDLRRLREIQVRMVPSVEIASALGLGTQPGLFVGIKKQKVMEHLPVTQLTRTNIRKAIEEYLTKKGMIVASSNEQLPMPHKNPVSSLSADTDERDLAIIEHVKANRDVIFQADLETALRYSLSHELVKYNLYNAEQLEALKNFVSVLKKYSPLADNGKQFLIDLNVFIGNASDLYSKQLLNRIHELESKHEPMHPSSQYIGCRPSVNGRRGYSCGLWQLFHYLTIQATNSNQTNNPLEVLKAIHGYVKNFFGCAHCSEHFQEMSARNAIFDVKTKDEAALWLWKAHNEVNQRLAGDNTEDPAFPKIQYPSKEICSQCYQPVLLQYEGGTTPSSTTQWNMHEVLLFLRRIYNPLALSQYGVDDESVVSQLFGSPGNAESKDGSETVFSSAVSGLNKRRGHLLIVFSLLVVVIAVKILLHFGYRMKIYNIHEPQAQTQQDIRLMDENH